MTEPPYRPEPNDSDAWADIVAAFNREDDQPVHPWPAAEDLDSAEDSVPEISGEAGAVGSGLGGPGTPGSAVPPVPPRPPMPPRIGRVLRYAERVGDDVEPEPEEPDEPEAIYESHIELDHYGGISEHFVPPTPPPLPQLDTVAKAAWAAIIAGSLVIVAAVVLGWAIVSPAGIAALAAVFGGLVTLFARMKDRDPDDYDDGAVV